MTTRANLRRLLPLASALILSALPARAAVTLIDKDDWKVLFGGFVEMDMIGDSTRSLSEVAGSTAIAANGYNAAEGRTLFSVRNSRLAFTVLAPNAGEWKTKGYVEMDFLGYDNAPAASNAPNQSDQSYLTNPTMRVRHAYFTAEKNGWQLLVGQYWTLFGWDPAYVLTTASVPPVTGTVYERTPQVTLTRTVELNDHDKLISAISVSRPAQRDGRIPNLDGGLRLALGGRRAGYVSSSGDIKSEPMSLALSGTFRELSVATLGGSATDQTRFGGGAGAVNAMIPILSTGDPKSYANTLAISGEYTIGKGYGDEFPSWSGGVAQSPTGAASNPSSNTNIDAALGGFGSDGAFHLTHLQTWNAELQYHLPDGMDSFITAGYGNLFSDNVTEMGGTYNRSRAYFANFFHDFSTQLRAAIEVDRFLTSYVNGNEGQDTRLALSAWYRF